MDKAKILILASNHSTEKVGLVENIERTLRILLLHGFSKEKIYIIKDRSVQINSNLVMKFQEINYQSNKNERSSIALKKAVDVIGHSSDLLVIDSDVILDTGDLDLFNLKWSSNVALVRKPSKTKEKGLKIRKEDGCFLVDNEFLRYPYYLYCGLIYVQSKSIATILNQNVSVLENIANIGKLKLIDKSELNSGEIISRDLTGGSFANLKKKIVVKKQAFEEGAEKLSWEIQWLKELNVDVSHKFPPIIDSHISDNYSWFEMPFYDLPNLRKNILSGKFTKKDILFYLRKIVNFVFVDLYKRLDTKVDDSWLDRTHYDRVINRFDYLKGSSNIFKELLNCKTIVINNKVYKNLPSLISEIKNNDYVNEHVVPTTLYRIHGDLHFQNMLIDEINEDFILADPRGELSGSDIFYDMGKLYHSVNGKYDLIHTDLSTVDLKFDEDSVAYISFDYGDDYLESFYEELKVGLLEVLNENKMLNQDPHFQMKMEFNEVMHFSSVMSFHLKNDDTENRALSLFCAAVMISDAFIAKNIINSKDVEEGK